jgi:S-adenosylmethionine decarboxylase
MAYTDSLFQLGMDLTRSSTAQKEDFAQTRRAAHVEEKNEHAARSQMRPAGMHLIIDLFGAQRLDDLKHIKETLRRCAVATGARLLHIHLNRLPSNSSVSGVAVLAEGHISLHSWPQARNLSLHVFMGAATAPHASIAAVKEAFGPAKVVVREYPRRTHEGRAAMRTSKKAAARERAQQAA